MKRCILGYLLADVMALPCLADEVENVRVATAMTEAINARDLAEFKAFLETDFATVSDSTQEIDIIFGGGDYVAVRARYIGTQDGPMGPFPARKLVLRTVDSSSPWHSFGSRLPRTF